MSERAPTATLTVAPQYERGTAPVAENMPEVSVSPVEAQTTPERPHLVPTGEVFAQQAERYEISLRDRDHFDETYFTDTEGASDMAVYARILDRVVSIDDSDAVSYKSLNGAEELARAHMRAKTTLNEARHALSLSPEARIAAMQNMIVERSNGLSEEEIAKNSDITALKRTVSRYNMDEEARNKPRVALATVMEKSEEFRQTKDAATFGETARLFNEDMQDMGAEAHSYKLLAESLAPKELVNEAEITKAATELDDVRERLANKNARREKTVLTGNTPGDQELKTIKDEYNKKFIEAMKIANATLFDDPTIPQVEKIRRYAELVAAEGNRLEEETPLQYDKTNTWVGRAMEKYGNLSTTKKVLFGGLGALAVGALTGGAGAFVVSGAAMASGLENARRQKRKAGAGSVNFDATELMKNLEERLDGQDGRMTIDTINLDAAAELMQANVHNNVDKRIGKERLRRSGRLLGSFAVALAAGSLVQHITEGGLLFGSDQAAAVDPSNASGVGTEQAAQIQPPAVETPLPSAEAFIGQSNVYVSPGDGFYSVFENMNIPESQWNSILQQVGPDLVQSGDAYWMPDGTPGLSNSGMLSQHAFEAIMRAKGL